MEGVLLISFSKVIAYGDPCLSGNCAHESRIISSIS
jgi:hypothetical protein